MKRFSKITTTQLARICGVSQGTVDRALHDRGEINPQTRERILQVAREYDYLPHTPQGREQENSMLIGVVLFDLYNEYFSKLAMSLVNEARKYGYSVIFQFSAKDGKNERAALDYFDYIGVDGIVLFSVGSDSEEYREYLRSLRRPLVLAGNPLFDLPFVGIDDERAMYDLATAVAKQAPTGDILYYAPILARPLHEKNAQRLRLAGFLRAMAELERGYRIVTEVEELSDFGGVVCSTDHYVLQAQKHLGYPRELPMGGFDNISALPSRVQSVAYSTDGVAEQCLNYLLGKPYSPRLPHRLAYNTD